MLSEILFFFSLERKEAKVQEPTIPTHKLNGIALVQSLRAAS
jgi:hypothetical protein